MVSNCFSATFALRFFADTLNSPLLNFLEVLEDASKNSKEGYGKFKDCSVGVYASAARKANRQLPQRMELLAPPPLG